MIILSVLLGKVKPAVEGFGQEIPKVAGLG
jgi:hypothetical protein